MPNNKPHIMLNTARQSEQSVRLVFHYGNPDQEDDENERSEDPNYFQLATSFRGYLNRYTRDLQIRIQNRNQQLAIPANIDYIRILFQGQFSIKANQNNYYQQWMNEFGLLGISFSKFNHEVLFAIADRDRFNGFIENISRFIAKETGENSDLDYARKVVYIKEFKLLTTSDILQTRITPNEQIGLLNFDLIEFPLNVNGADEIRQSLITYLNARDIRYRLGEDNGFIEVYDITGATAIEIANNYDIVLNVTSSLSTIIRPSELNLERREYGFTISNGDDDLPVVGILDTGIGTNTPLAPIIINDNTFNLTGSSPFEDNANDNYGHGTSVAALAALGREPYLNNYRGAFNADAKLLSIKLLDANSGFLSEIDVLGLLRRAKQSYPTMKLFVLTICYSDNKATNEDFSTYAYELDKFSHENDCLIFICTANNNDAAVHNTSYDLNYFFGETTNLCRPAESMNNVIVGAAAHSIKDGIFFGISNGKEYPTLYTRKSHIDFTGLFPKGKRNKNYFRPDVIECAGDFEQVGRYIGKGTNAVMDLLSSNPAFGFYQDAGTSFSTPLTANIGAKILKLYPNLRAQTVKALIVNGASVNNIRFDRVHTPLLTKTSGHGFVNPASSVLSNNNEITFIVEETINPEEVKIIPLNFPEYLRNENLGKTRGIVRIAATLCFSFDPIMQNQLGYCPIHMAFSFFKNQSGEDILKPDDEIQSKLKTTLTWSQNGRYKSKPIPPFNTQKIHLNVNVDDLVNEESTFKLAVNCRVNSQLLPGQEDRYAGAHKFSIAITIRENLPEARLTNKLYDEMVAINEVTNIATVDLEGEAEV